MQRGMAQPAKPPKLARAMIDFVHKLLLQLETIGDFSGRNLRDLISLLFRSKSVSTVTVSTMPVVLPMMICWFAYRR